MAEHMERLPIEARSVEWQAMEENFRKQVIRMSSIALRTTIFRELPKSEQIECLIAGVMTGLMCSCLATVKPETYQIVEDYMARCVAVARTNAEELLRQAGSK
ncbi:hypothetical protein [Bradyrhizobium paxllaeri]|uniref:hypothetical protein n=1 Tax=Bradyrhizobium paxllaeri TaxID=190148 RepID=UPI000810427D|nr:hypothetical protein [Bradyrhizobium paxllaeri]